MARFLTPAKIGLLVLIDLYTEDAVPSDAILPVLSFITSHLMDHVSLVSTPNPPPRWAKAEQTVSLIIAIKDFEKLLGNYPGVVGLPGRTLWDHFLGKLWDTNSLDALHEFFDRLPAMLAKSKEELKRLGSDGEGKQSGTKLSQNSPFGVFIRRARLEHQRLRFHDFTELWRDFVRYRQPTAHYMRRKQAGFSRLSFDSVLLLGEQDDWDSESVSALASIAYGDLLTGDQSGTQPVSTEDIENLLEFQIEQMQRMYSLSRAARRGK
jgi:anaphase-promoting complex subunit 5